MPRIYGSPSEQASTKFRTSGDNKEVTLAVPASLTGASNTFTTPNVTGTTDTIISRVSVDQGSDKLQNKDLDSASMLFVASGDVTKKLALNLNNLTTATTRTLIIPDVDDTLVTLAATQVLSNKTLTAPQINDTSADHQYIFGVSELAADRTVSLPLLTGNDTFVFNDHAATLTNKTIDADSNTISNIDNNEIKAAAGIEVSKLEALTASKLIFTNGSGVLTATSVTEGAILIGDASTNPVELTIGASGTVLTSNGTTASWDTPAGTGDVTAAANITDNALVRGDGGAKGVQSSGITIDDNDNMSGMEFMTHPQTPAVDLTVTSGNVGFHPLLTISALRTLTINSGGQFNTMDTLTNEGIVVNNGTLYIS